MYLFNAHLNRCMGVSAATTCRAPGWMLLAKVCPVIASAVLQKSPDSHCSSRVWPCKPKLNPTLWKMPTDQRLSAIEVSIPEGVLPTNRLAYVLFTSTYNTLTVTCLTNACIHFVFSVGIYALDEVYLLFDASTLSDMLVFRFFPMLSVIVVGRCLSVGLGYRLTSHCKHKCRMPGYVLFSSIGYLCLQTHVFHTNNQNGSFPHILDKSIV